ncbi:MAG: hypothetical protein LBM64_07935 [Deltaproteobacteria bacterium]|jgi:hypothetical protein|nr:hypothetical protein [Deltaproteobacteria bacterium]
MTVHDLLDLRDCISISRHEPGLLQLKLSLAILQRPAARELMSLGRGHKSPALLEASFNIFSRSATLEYDAGLVNPDDINRFFNSDAPDEVGRLAGKVAELFGVDLNLA